MDAAVEQVFAGYDKRFAEEAVGRAGSRRLSSNERSLPIGEEAGAFLDLLIKALQPKHLLELGTSNGYSTVWLAEAARAIGGRVITIEALEKKQAYARAAVTKAGLADVVEFRRCARHLEDAAGSVRFRAARYLERPLYPVLRSLLSEVGARCGDRG